MDLHFSETQYGLTVVESFQSHHLIAFSAIFKEKIEPSVSRNAQPKAALQLPLHKCSNLLVTSVRLW